ncbi:hypothetical protein [Lyngbya sp. PCC 8106]|uniref:hypothetical protein n=1 Tax=Lyngbya sp. (strain PCC 8106) TaxID=313612 RepID=UPI0000EAA37C|nr:hypothetical protein [Lyngbya sp. PCC 8106]EAW35435.1 tRNA (guanine-N(1)-)-methyltransferase [Lyngbya sp. PCC 8106]
MTVTLVNREADDFQTSENRKVKPNQNSQVNPSTPAPVISRLPVGVEDLRLYLSNAQYKKSKIDQNPPKKACKYFK